MAARHAPHTAVESLLRSECLQYLAAPLAAALLSWAWLLPASLDMYGPMNGPSAWMMQPHWDLPYGLMIFAMWAVMMTAMMLPSLAPALLLYGGICRSDVAGGSPVQRVYLFAAGYLAAWAAFSAGATLLQWQLATHERMTMMMELADPRLGAGALILGGAYQWTPFKQACLSRCRSPAEFITRHWQRGLRGAAALGFGYGLYCLGCCWALMLILFTCGVMNLACIVLLSLLVMAEKSARWGVAAARICGLLLIGLGMLGLFAPA